MLNRVSSVSRQYILRKECRHVMVVDLYKASPSEGRSGEEEKGISVQVNPQWFCVLYRSCQMVDAQD